MHSSQHSVNRQIGSLPVYVGDLAFTSESVRRCVTGGVISVVRMPSAGAAATAPSWTFKELAMSLLAPLVLLAVPPSVAGLCFGVDCLARRCARLSTCRTRRPESSEDMHAAQLAGMQEPSARQAPDISRLKTPSRPDNRQPCALEQN